MGILRFAGLRLHRCFTWNRALARSYGLAWQCLLAQVPEGKFKAHLRNNLIDADWPDGSLSAQRVELADGVPVKLKGRRGSLALRKGLFRQRLAHEPEVFDFLLAQSARYDAVIEVGANIGVYTLLFAQRLVMQDGRPRVFAFEPSRRAYADLLEHLAINGVTNVVPFNCAIGPGPQLAIFYENDRDLMKGTLDANIAPLFDGGGDRITTTLVAGLEEVRQLALGFDRLLLKVDVIGSEPAVLSELRGFIESSQPQIVIGVWSGNRAGLNALTWLDERYELSRIEAGTLAARVSFEDDSYCNYFLTPRGDPI